MVGVSLAPAAANMSSSVDRDNLFFWFCFFFLQARTPSLPASAAAVGKCRENIHLRFKIPVPPRHVGTVSGDTSSSEERLTRHVTTRLGSLFRTNRGSLLTRRAETILNRLPGLVAHYRSRRPGRSSPCNDAQGPANQALPPGDCNARQPAGEEMKPVRRMGVGGLNVSAVVIQRYWGQSSWWEGSWTMSRHMGGSFTVRRVREGCIYS